MQHDRVLKKLNFTSRLDPQGRLGWVGGGGGREGGSMGKILANMLLHV